MTDHLPLRSASVTSMNLPCLKAWALKGLMVVLINDMGLVPRGVGGKGNRHSLGRPMQIIKSIDFIDSIGIVYHKSTARAFAHGASPGADQEGYSIGETRPEAWSPRRRAMEVTTLLQTSCVLFL